MNQDDFLKMIAEDEASKYALVAIDVQRLYADPDYVPKNGCSVGNERTDRTAEHIAEILPEFRAADVKIYWVYQYKDTDFGSERENPSRPEECRGGFHRVTPASGDQLVPKNKDSAFSGSNIKDRLEAEGITNIIVVGFDAGVCVPKTVFEALFAGYNVCVLSDGVETSAFYAGKKEMLENMQRRGAVILSSHDVLAALERRRNGAGLARVRENTSIPDFEI